MSRCAELPSRTKRRKKSCRRTFFSHSPTTGSVCARLTGRGTRVCAAPNRPHACQRPNRARASALQQCGRSSAHRTPCRSSILSGRYFWQTRLAAILQGRSGLTRSQPFRVCSPPAIAPELPTKPWARRAWPRGSLGVNPTT